MKMNKSFNFLYYNREAPNPYLIFLPFLFIYIIIIIVFQKNIIVGDEIRFIGFAEYLTEGHYISPDKAIGNGPGYSIILTPFIFLKLPLVLIKIMNAFLHYFSIIFLYKSFREYVSFKMALIFSLFWACYFNTLVYLHLVYSEVFASFLVTAFLYYLIKAIKIDDRRKKIKNAVLAGFLLGFLVLTKVIFGYVILVMLLGGGLLWLLNRRERNYKTHFLILLTAFFTVTPYLIYTYRVTGKFFYWTTNSGENLYWMTTNHKGEYGTWFPIPNDFSTKNKIQNAPPPEFLNYKEILVDEHLIPGGADTIRARHLKDFQEVYRNSRTAIEEDVVLKRIAINNIKENPGGYIQNCFSNIGRILFNFPYSYSVQRPATLIRIPLNGVIVLLVLFCLIPTFLNWREVIFPIRFIVLFVFLYLGGSVLVCAEIRMFSVIVPMLLFWVAYILSKSVNIRLKFNKSLK
jgi:Dolichyl-phosphate-mannose-protein mannosyltransferase